MHVCLPPLDAAHVVEQEWGVTFPLAGGPAPGGIIDYGLVLLYAPRDEEEEKVVMKIMEAGIKYNVTFCT